MGLLRFRVNELSPDGLAPFGQEAEECEGSFKKHKQSTQKAASSRYTTAHE
jgi:hypothetical protein